jgi:hypothetical protein
VLSPLRELREWPPKYQLAAPGISDGAKAMRFTSERDRCRYRVKETEKAA